MISARHTIKNYRRIPAEHLVRTARLDEPARLVKEYPSVRTIQRRVVDDATAAIGHRRDVGLNNLPCLQRVRHVASPSDAGIEHFWRRDGARAACSRACLTQSKEASPRADPDTFVRVETIAALVRDPEGSRPVLVNIIGDPTTTVVASL